MDCNNPSGIKKGEFIKFTLFYAVIPVYTFAFLIL